MQTDMLDLTISIVVYNNDVEELSQAVDSVLNSKSINLELYIVDNSPTDRLRYLFTDSRVKYLFNDANIGFGAGHNIAIKKAFKKSRFHLILNPDIYFASNILSQIVDYMSDNVDCGLLMPKVCNPDGSIRYIRRLLPTLFDVFFNKFISFTTYAKKREEKYRTKFIDYNAICSAPFLSGCFMFCRTDMLNKLNGFDERFFMYFEDVDLSRRFYSESQTVYYPKVSVVHLAHQDSHRNFKLFRIHLKSAIKYFNKYGWFYDNNAKKINTENYER